METETCPYQTPSAQSKGRHPVRDHIKLLEEVDLTPSGHQLHSRCGFTTRQKPRENEGEPILFPTSRMKPVTSQIDAAIDVRGSNLV